MGALAPVLCQGSPLTGIERIHRGHPVLLELFILFLMPDLKFADQG